MDTVPFFHHYIGKFTQWRGGKTWRKETVIEWLAGGSDGLLHRFFLAFPPENQPESVLVLEENGTDDTTYESFLPFEALDPSVAAERVAEVLALPGVDRAFLARQLMASLDDTVDADAETRWQEVIDRRSREIDEGKVGCRPVDQVVADIRHKLNARHQPS